MERRTVIYGGILTVLIVALAAVGVLILRKRSVATVPPVVSTGAAAKKLPTDTKPYASLPHEEPWKPGTPIPKTGFDPTYPEQPPTSTP